MVCYYLRNNGKKRVCVCVRVCVCICLFTCQIWKDTQGTDNREYLPGEELCGLRTGWELPVYLFFTVYLYDFLTMWIYYLLKKYINISWTFEKVSVLVSKGNSPKRGHLLRYDISKSSSLRWAVSKIQALICLAKKNTRNKVKKKNGKIFIINFLNIRQFFRNH